MQADRTADTVLEMRREVSELLGDRPMTSSELEMARNGLVRSLPASWETLRDLSSSLEEIIAYSLPPDYYDRYVQGILDLSAEQVMASATQHIALEKFVWVVVGDLDEIRPQLEAADLGKLQELDNSLI